MPNRDAEFACQVMHAEIVGDYDCGPNLTKRKHAAVSGTRRRTAARREALNIEQHPVAQELCGGIQLLPFLAREPYSLRHSLGDQGCVAIKPGIAEAQSRAVVNLGRYVFEHRENVALLAKRSTE
jgi:hypothetical protein